MKNIKSFFLCGFFYSSLAVFSQSGIVTNVKDGDIVTVIDSLNQKTTFKLAEVDCPDRGQPFRTKANDFTKKEIIGKKIFYEILSEKGFFLKAKVFYEKKYLSEEIIKNGLGWYYEDGFDSENLKKLQEVAKKNKIGLWIDIHSLEPSVFSSKKRIPGFHGW